MPREYIFIHERFYDLNSLKESHPGGYLKIFECIGNEKDCTALFESSHCMKDINYIYELMKSYEIKPEFYQEFGITKEILEEKKQLPKFNFDNYHELSKEVKMEFKNNENYKVTKFWYFKIIILFIMYAFCYYKGMIKNKNSETFVYENYLLAFLAGILWINIGFCILHDASHYGLYKTKDLKNKDNFIINAVSFLFNFTLNLNFINKKSKIIIKTNKDVKNINVENEELIKKSNNNLNTITNNVNRKSSYGNTEEINYDLDDKNKNNKIIYFGILKYKKNNLNKNDILNSILQGWTLWNSYIWFKHHSYAHHSFTGIFGLDPDLIHLKPLARKTKSDKDIMSFLVKIQPKTICFILIIFPGLYFWQVIGYLVSAFDGSFCKVPIPKVFQKTPILEMLLYLLSLSIMIFNKNYLCVYFYFLGLNLMYAICIVPDHDLYESAIENEKATDDWCEMQIRKSGNFCEDNVFITELNGGINNQIQHHLFPTISHCHYKKISEKIIKYCERKNIPYVNKNSLMEVYESYMRTIESAAVSDEKEDKKE